MNFSIVTEISGWYFLLCIIIALLFAGLLYYRNRQNSELSNYQVIFLAVLRGLLVLLVALLLLKPAFKIVKKTIQKPLIVFAQDNSTSLKYGADSLKLGNDYRQNVDEIISQLKNDFEVITCEFGEQVERDLSFSFSDKSTNVDALFEYLQTDLYNRNLAGVVLASDGINNKGSHPVYRARQMDFPIYTLALGDTIPKVDVTIHQIDYNKEVFLGNQFPVFINVKANGFIHKGIEIQLLKNGKVIKNQHFDIDSKSFFKKFTFQLKADKRGVQAYDIRLINTPENDNAVNNQQTIFIKVRDDVKKILFLQSGWHPDASVFNQVIARNPEYELDISNLNEFKGRTEDYALIVLHQLPSKSANISTILQQIVKNNIPVLFILGENSNLSALNSLKWGLSIQQNSPATDDVRGYINPEFSKFTFNYSPDEIQNFPPLSVPFGNYNKVPPANIFIYQAVGDVVTSKPLIFFSETGGQKVGFIAGDGLWRWRIHEYSINYNHNITNNLIIKIIHYLSVKRTDKRFVVEVDDIIDENNDILFTARLYNASNELVNSPEVKMTIKSEQGDSYPFTFSKDALAYTLNAGTKAPGQYSYTAETQIGSDVFTENGAFLVKKVQIEQQNLTANHNLLYRLSSVSNGGMFYPNETTALVNSIIGNKHIKEKEIKTKTLDDLLNYRWYFIILLLLCSMEWFLRKFWGMI